MPMLSNGARLGEFELVRHAATGAMSEVYEARHVTSGVRTAVKVLLPELLAYEDLIARFLNEGRLLQHLRHVRIVTAFSCGTLPEGSPYMVLEWLPINLHQALARVRAALPSRIAMRIAQQLADALATLHERGIVHRDLKPSNVLLVREDSTSWEVKLADLGLAKVLPHEANREDAGSSVAHPVSTGGNTTLGTWDYMAPEQWVQSKDADPKADVYALGILLFQLLTGQLPFIAEEQKDFMYLHLLEQPPLDQLDGLVPVTTRELIARMLAKKPSPRPTMREVQERLAEPPTP